MHFRLSHPMEGTCIYHINTAECCLYDFPCAIGARLARSALSAICRNGRESSRGGANVVCVMDFLRVCVLFLIFRVHDAFQNLVLWANIIIFHMLKFLPLSPAIILH